MAGPTWQTYDEVADAYARVAERCHAELARDLVAAVAPAFGARVLDLGAGSGVAAQAAAASAGVDGDVVALDPSTALVSLARRDRVRPVAGSAPGLPFASASFDVAVASLVLGHFPDYRPALADLRRVLRPGGRLGVATWGRTDDATPIDDADERAAYALWDDVVGRRVDLGDVNDAAAAAMPWEAWFTEPEHVRDALAEADLRVVDVVGRAYRYPLSHEEWLQRVDTGPRARFVRARIGPAAYETLSDEVRGALASRGIPDPIRCADETLVTVATAPSDATR